MTTHEIIEAEEVPVGVRLKIQWREPAHVTTGFYSTQHAKALGWKRPDPQPVDPAWMVEVSRAGCATTVEGQAQELAVKYREGVFDEYPFVRASIAALRLALSRGHVVLAPVMPSEEEMLAAAVEDAAQANERQGSPTWARDIRAREHDNSYDVQCALQARRNVYASLGAVKKTASSGPVVPEVDLRAALEEAWTQGYASAGSFLVIAAEGGRGTVSINIANLYANERSDDVSDILENLKSGEA